MDVHQARAFLAVAEELHFGRAAARLHMAQPPLSRMIRQIENELGAVMFERSTRHVRLTPHGEALVGPARELVMLAERMPEVVRRVDAGESGHLRLGFAGASVQSVVSALVRRIHRERPGLTFELDSSTLSFNGLEALLEDRIDIVIGRWDFLPKGVSSRVIAEEDLLLALPEDHPLAAEEAIHPRDLAKEPWIAMPGGGGATLSHRLQQIGRIGRFVPRIVQTVPDSSAEFLMVAAGLGVALPFSGVRDNLRAPGVVFRPLAVPMGGVQTRMAWRDGDDPVVRAVVAVSRDLFPGEDGDAVPE